jgi:hypothetical protein
MALAPQTAMPYPAPTTRPQPPARASMSRHVVLSPTPEPRVGGVVARLAGLMMATSFAVGFAAAIVLAVITGTLTQLGH